MEIKLIPALDNNYIFLIYHSQSQIAAVVDPAQAGPTLKQLDKLGLKLVAIFNTHHHHDHVGGNLELSKHFPDVCIYGGEHDRGRIPGQQQYLQEGDRLEFAGVIAEILYIPGHTQGHIAYYFREGPGDLFCGDTLFAGSCGRLLEGTPEQMLNSLTRLRSLPDSTKIWCAHEYTLKNLAFALTVEPDNLELQKRYQGVKDLRNLGLSTIPSDLGLEKRTNPFLRWDQPGLQQSAGSQDPVTVFGRIRKLKDNY
ncbi:hydroxyacylglutathione hydrolase [Gloeocapsa sp. PCC 73106]|uniref:hydroxyacylglutathione hydrolase n=1 Tax=Gloeocapsa sp. PCC 73106 TaxID=102232 RepID=UPI000553D35E|nr:hydroxyacylglutathione hydrolase [Gloeocapsa sp. PCC 73106]